jgi:hypothetical protein
MALSLRGYWENLWDFRAAAENLLDFLFVHDQGRKPEKALVQLQAAAGAERAHALGVDPRFAGAAAQGTRFGHGFSPEGLITRSVMATNLPAAWSANKSRKVAITLRVMSHLHRK